MFMKMNSAAFGAALVLFAGTINAGAAAVGYTDFDSWSAAVPGSTALAIPEPVPNVVDEYDPPNLLPGFEHIGSGTASFSYKGVLFETNSALGDGFFFNVGPTFSGSNGNLPVLSSQAKTTFTANILITLAAPVNAFALNFGTFDGSEVTFTLSNGEEISLGSSNTSFYKLTDFFGVTDNNPFNTILLTSSDRALNLNQLMLGAAVAPIPEPATWVMLLLGFAGIGLFGARLSARRATGGADRQSTRVARLPRQKSGLRPRRR